MSRTSGPQAAFIRDDDAIIQALRAGDEGTFVHLVTAHSAALLQLALPLVGARAIAEEVVGETWRSVLGRLEEFDGRTSLRAWVFLLASDILRARAASELLEPIPALGADGGKPGPSVEPDRFLPPDDPRYPGHWAREPVSWGPPELSSSADTQQVILAAISQLPPGQRLVLTLRDVQGWSVTDVCDALSLTEGAQRALLQHGRATVRTALDEVLCA